LYVTALAIAPSAGKTYYAALSDGSFWVGHDAGNVTNWTEADIALKGVAAGNVVDIRINPTDPNNVFVVTNGGGGRDVWMTSSGGIPDPFFSWINVTGNLPTNLGVNTISVDWRFPTPVLYVGTNRGVYVCKDEPLGEPIPSNLPPPPPPTHWAKFGTNLPNTDVNDLEFASQLNVMAAATYGRGAFEVTLLPPKISGYIYQDHNGNGRRDRGDQGLAGRIVFLATTGSGNYDGRELHTTTDVNSNFAFTDVPPGTYFVREVVPRGWMQTTRNPAKIILTARSSFSGLSFGERRT
jgi:hypothetical protein